MTANDGRGTAVSQAPRKILIENKSKRGKTVQTMYERKQTGAKKLPPPLIFRPCPAKLSPRAHAHANNERQFIILGITSSPHGSGSPIQISFEYVCLHIGFGFGSDADGGSIIWRDIGIIPFYCSIAVAVAVSVFSCASHVPPHQAPDLSRNISSRRRNISRSIAIADTANTTVTTHQAPDRSSRIRSRSSSIRSTSRSIAIADTATVTPHQAPDISRRIRSRSRIRNTSRSITIADTAVATVTPHQAPDIRRFRRFRRNTSRSIAIADTAVVTVTPHQAPDRIRRIRRRRRRRRNTSRSMAIADTASVTPHQAPDRRFRRFRRRRNTPRSIAIADTTSVTTHQAPDIRRFRRNTSRSIAIADMSLVIPHQPPDRRFRRFRRRIRNTSRGIAFINSPQVAACQNTPFDNRSAYCVHSKVFDNSPCSQISKKAWIILDIKIIYAKVSSVERTGETT